MDPFSETATNRCILHTCIFRPVLFCVRETERYERERERERGIETDRQTDKTDRQLRAKVEVISMLIAKELARRHV